MATNESRSKTPVLEMTTQISELSLNGTSRTPSGSLCLNGSLNSALQTQSNLNTNIPFNKAKGGLKRRELTPSRNPNFMGIGGGDRYIPCRSSTQFEYANHCLVNHNVQGELLSLSGSLPSISPGRKEEKKYMMHLMRAKSAGEVNIDDERILIYRRGQAPPVSGQPTHRKVLYSSTNALPISSARKGLRHIPTTPERILDAPNYIDDYYLNLIDWGHHNCVGVALAYSVYLWNAGSGEIETLFELPSERGTFISSVKWAGEGPYLAIGLSDGQIKIFDPTKPNCLLRTMQTQITRIPSLSWRQHVLSAGCRSGRIYNHDVRIANHHIGTFESHTQEVCGLVWSPNGRYLASGGGDDLVNIWKPEMISSNNPVSSLFCFIIKLMEPFHTFTDHTASVKALAFDPNSTEHLASGGGTNDRSIKIWNITSGTLCSSEQTESQVNAILFSRHYKEIITGHGYPRNDLKIWKYPSMTCVQTLTGHTERVLNLCRSPCGQYVISASGDETLRLWWCFKTSKNPKPLSNAIKKRTILQQSVR
ncbi:unnamed protein product [Dracunculus medinensis]|uniref:WD_REPEATS_REGION domain-containing protein n=1 Tax=Dracunculus medinensis TaxID=318479 RepID=A0A0N4UME1_DRAME|nr:unnamed protein product [Dracunculus medinensis]